MSKVKQMQQRVSALKRFLTGLDYLMATHNYPAASVHDREMNYYKEYEDLCKQFKVDLETIIGHQIEQDEAKLDAIEELLRGEE